MITLNLNLCLEEFLNNDNLSYIKILGEKPNNARDGYFSSALSTNYKVLSHDYYYKEYSVVIWYDFSYFNNVEISIRHLSGIVFKKTYKMPYNFSTDWYFQESLSENLYMIDFETFTMIEQIYHKIQTSGCFHDNTL